MSDFNAPVTTENKPEITTNAQIKQSSGEMSVGNLWASMIELVKNPEVDATKIGHLVDIQGQMIDRAAQDRFRRAFAQACQNMPTITKDDKIEHNGKFIGWFKKYEDLRVIVDDIINPLGLTITHDSAPIDGAKGGLNVWTIITYMDPEYTWQEERGKMPMPPDAGGAKGAAQAIGSAMTYGHRYSLAAAFGIVQKGLDRDGKTPAPLLESDNKYQGLLDDAQKAASKGSKAYTAWMGGLTNVQKGWLVTHDHHANMSRAAKVADQQE